MKALISPNEKINSYDIPPVELGYRVAEIADDSHPIAEPLFWVDCDDTIVADKFYYSNNQFVSVPTAPPKANTVNSGNNSGPKVI